MEEDEFGAENLEDGELWLPSDFFSMDEVQVTTPLHCYSSSYPNPSHFHPHNHTLFKPLPTLQRFKPPVCYGTHDLCDCGTRSRWTGFSPVHQVPRLNPVQAQFESFMGERAWGLLQLQRQLRNRVYLNRVLPAGGLGMMSSAHGGTGVFLPRTPNNNMQPPRNHSHSCVRKGHRMMSKHEIQLPPRKILLNRRREETR